ncbi:hypothetical protein [Pseudomonas chlororaphis]|uniref:hypothetical protein n=1 Tax=Pseudomonas chlororaphis TaxID=587753 RepID=UPI0007B33376|nr:hypothetical protein [Pseudomonas chlororaphis]AZC50456.1 hypothetical protein C4K35_2873 [Pseudomonas chlororaphis subsp. piscium]AZC57032.1 hypothetical protein C4K34_2867 [Pseudomonas chlororaphis subsp. piscium]AZC63258.1 hypothetical protein C4K33_2766 [Pseudomonas chlororaphis subsp. piscium]AZC75666.1 hypothetical protein C4K31_2763 [Pseudomonas chlororaphis subsp. piscium]KZO49585.1 putative membrane protein [Pseudomonas chlororaphis subsp. piscium]
MAHSILTSAKRGAYVAIGLYLAMVLLVSLSAQTPSTVQPQIQVAYPAIQFEHRAQAAEQAPDAGVALL